MNTPEIQQKSAWTDLILFMLITLACFFSVSLLVGMAALALFGNVDFLMGVSDGSSSTPYYFYIVLGLSSVGTFLLPTYIFQRMNKHVVMFPKENINDWKIYVLSILFLFAFSPIMSVIGEWNMQMKLPEAWQNIEQWMRTKEDEAAALMGNILMTTEWDKLLINIVILAVLPGIGEELFFRGALQQIGVRIFKNEYLTVWIVAIIFSAIHFQFYGFFPRLLLGVFFGYMVVWSRNIWTAVVAHFINNSMVVILAFYYATQGKSYAELMESDSYSIIVYIGSFVISAVVAFAFYQYTTRIKLYGKRVD